MDESESYEKFPVRVVVLSNFVALLIYAAGAYILSDIWIGLSVLFLLYCLWIEIRILKKSCTDCYYYGKVCGFGKGKLCSLLYRKGDPQNFAEKDISWVQVLPEFLVIIFPVLGGFFLSIRDFTLLPLIFPVLLIVLSFIGNAVIRGSFVCKYCKQREIGCPAEKLFRKE